jgi:DivIVA domain-containing protein
MDLSELTPELFEKTEFTERRRGYDIDQVERFLEDAGTALAQLLVKYRQLEERSAHAESRLSAAEARASAAEEALAKGAAAPAAAAPAPRPASGMSEQQEIEQATSTLLMAKRTADATIGEARAEASGILAEARARAEHVVTEARAEADNELAEGTVRLREAVTALERRRDALSSVVSAFDTRIEEYRRQVSEVAESLTAMASDPEALAERPHMVIPEAATGHTEAMAPVSSAQAFASVDQPTEAYETLAEAGTWGNGSWSSVVDATATPAEAGGPAAGEAGGPAAGEAEELISLSDLEPATGQTNDRFLRELDEAVNDHRPEGEDAMTAFFEPTEEPGRRFGWRR